MTNKSSSGRRTIKKESNEQVIEQVRQLAWTGHHAKAIDLAAQALSDAGRVGSRTAPTKMDLLDLRAESYIAQGKLDLAAKDASAMMKLAKTVKKPALIAQALNRKVDIQFWLSEYQSALRTALSATKIKHSSPKVLAESLFYLAEAQNTAGQYTKAVDTAQKAIVIFQKAGEISSAGRAYLQLARAYYNLRRIDDSRQASQRALELCQSVGDQYGIGEAQSRFGITEIYIAKRIEQNQQAYWAYEAAGYVIKKTFRLGTIAYNYYQLGLFHRARRMSSEIVEILRTQEFKAGLTFQLGNLLGYEIIVGMLDSARVHLQEYAELV
ncbi:MAG TPA: hypothetical protein VMJ90_00735, partial [Anaerolineales bacterium]|nr:hypothetical protein [Anaerolineales bacterium]